MASIFALQGSTNESRMSFCIRVDTTSSREGGRLAFLSSNDMRVGLPNVGSCLNISMQLRPSHTIITSLNVCYLCTVTYGCADR